MNATKAITALKQSIKFYERRLTYWLELKAEIELENGNRKTADLKMCENNIQKYEIVLSDLATIKRAINVNKPTVKIYGTAKNRNQMYKETFDALKDAGINIGNIGGDDESIIITLPLKEA